MKRRIMYCIVVLFLPFLIVGCSRAEKLTAPLPSQEASRSAAALKTDCQAAHPADLSGLTELLAAAAAIQPETAGSSLRVAALGKELLEWLRHNPETFSSAELSAAFRHSGLPPKEKETVLHSLRLLLDAASRMTEEQILALLWDAGCEAEIYSGERDGYCRFLERMIASLDPEIFKNGVGIMNISPDNHCRLRKSVL